MTYRELRQKAFKEYYPALLLGRIFPKKIQKHLRDIMRGLVLLLMVASLFVFGLAKSHSTLGIVHYASVIYGLFLIFFSVWIVLLALQAFYYSFYFKDVAGNPSITYNLAAVIYKSNRRDLISSFLNTHFARSLLIRLDIPEADTAIFKRDRKQILPADAFFIKDIETLSTKEYVIELCRENEEFRNFLFAYSIKEKELAGALEWLLERESFVKDTERWWARRHLGRIPGIGRDWAHGRAFTLEKYSHEVPMASLNPYEAHSVYGSKELKEIESVLIRQKEANALLVGNDKGGMIDIIARFCRLIEEGKIFPELEHKNVLILDSDALISSAGDKTSFEAQFIKVLKEAIYAENIILVIEDFPSFINSAHAVGTDIISLLDPYFSSSRLQIIAMSDNERFHEMLERNSLIMQRFEPILVKEIDEANTIRVLQNEVMRLEKIHHILFTYPALLSVVDSAERYFPDGIMPDKAIDILLDINPQMVSEGKQIIQKKDVLDFVQVKTGIPVGEVSKDEKEKLLNVETILHERIVGQNEAVTAIAHALRRARSGINNPERPLASFLFLGPTGVGKTETTKALAQIFFGENAPILRLDMSEYSGTDALSKLIGSFEIGKSGVLASMVREHPFGVLLLDEFEKTTPEVMNLFLQVLDEGFFSDMSGKKVITRNLLIIATSNAGSDLIWQAMKTGQDLVQAKQQIIDTIIKNGTLKPELLNRFDGVVIFHPLNDTHLKEIAKMMLVRLEKRLEEKGIKLIINDELIEFVIKFGTDPQFGARPMNRAIQEKVEQVIAEKMIKGEITPGSEVTLTSNDLNSVT